MSAALQGDSQEIVVMTRLYDAAVRQLVLKFEILNDEFKVLYARNPIHHIEGRVKSLPSIAAKLLKKGQPLTIEAAKRNVNDISDSQRRIKRVDTFSCQRIFVGNDSGDKAVCLPGFRSRFFRRSRSRRAATGSFQKSRSDYHCGQQEHRREHCPGCRCRV